MNNETIKTELKAPFPISDIEFRVSWVNKNTRKAYVLAYITARAIFERLDLIFGLDNWKDKYEVIKEGVVCSLSVRIDDKWITKQDAAPFTKIESLKGAFSDALKRAAVKFGIGRYLYRLPDYCVDLHSNTPPNADARKVHYHKSTDISGNWIEPELPPWALPEESPPNKSGIDNKDVLSSKPDQGNLENQPNRDISKVPDSNNRLTMKEQTSELLESLVLQGAVSERKKNEYYATMNKDGIGAGLLKYFYQQLLLIDKLYSLVRANKVNEDERKQIYKQILSSKMNQFHNIEMSLDNLAA